MPPVLQKLSAADTIDSPSRSEVLDRAFHHVGFVEGSRPHISSETANLLRSRLRAAAGFLGLGFGLFLVYRLLLYDNPFATNEFTLYFHIAVVVVLANAFARLCRRCQIPLVALRVYEGLIFGLPVAYFLLYDYQILSWAAQRNLLVNPLPFWMGLIFIYALYIPNSWRRAAWVIGGMCLAPLLLMVGMAFSDAAFRTALAEGHPFGFFFEVTILLLITFLSSTYGTHVISTLRREAFEARQLGQYRLCSLIGAGGMGEVYLAEHQMMKRPVAIKLIHPSQANDPQVLARFEREVRATAKLSHWNTIEIFDYGRTDDGTFYYVMEYLPGLSLNELVDKHGPLPAARAIHLLVQTCDALAEAHGRGLIHRDIKPGNIFSAQRGGYFDVAKLLDFGLAKPTATDSGVPVRLTQEGSITGSPLFMSPEQALGDHEPDARSDVYSLGAVAYFLLTGVPPFDGDRAIRIILAHAHDPVVPPSRLRAEIPADVEKVVLRCLAKNPDDRYQTIVELRQALSECVAAGGWTHEDAASWWRTNGAADAAAERMAAAAI